jgi:hypothetical protein
MGHTTRTCQVTIQKQKEIVEAEVRQNQPKQILHSASCYLPYIPEYVGNQQPTMSVASASHSQAAWTQLPPPPLAPILAHNQQPEGHRQAQQQRDTRKESEARTVYSTVAESRHIYSKQCIALTQKFSNSMYFYFFAFIFPPQKTIQEGLTFSLM